ncbi:Cytochrome b561 and DOMON domain-containing protein [Quillaja saponaria]|uniref:Cytochrome b561 and DOMON domain-containing protein n=1 Tax=Quillaja saponaria TaxID=32244 RepID=A0AAD7KV32_QUISA|nr:Cytochrome b561 and DOMON domain-containing protein [Quillaja saponaria]
MSSYYFLFLSLCVPLPSLFAQTSCNEQLSLTEIENLKLKIKHTPPSHSSHCTKTRDSRSHNGSNGTIHHQRQLRNVHWVLIIIGWGTFLPIGAIIARYSRQFSFTSNKWYPCHVLCQSIGYSLGTVGWGIGVWLGSSSKQYVSKTQRIVSTLVFTFTTIQVLSVFLQPREEYRK